MTDLLALVNAEVEDLELSPEILPVDARLSVRAAAPILVSLFERAASIAPNKEIVVGTAFSLLEAFPAESGVASYVQVTATDGEHSLAVVADEVTVVLAGAALLPAKKVLDILRLVPEDLVRIDVLGTSAVIRSGQAVWTVQTPTGDSLPPLPDVSGISLVPVGREKFLTALVAVRKAVSTQSARFSLMQMQVKNQNLTGADGARAHRLRVNELPVNLEMDIPVKVLDELAKALSKSQGDSFELGADDAHLAFRIDRDILIAQRLLLPFPDVEKMFLGPALNNQHRLEVNTKDLAAVIRRVRINADPEYAGVYLGILPCPKDASGAEQWLLKVRARDKTGNSATESLPVRWEGPKGARELCLNHRQMLDLLSSYDYEQIIFSVGDDTKTTKRPLLLEDQEHGFTAVVAQMMPHWG